MTDEYIDLSVYALTGWLVYVYVYVSASCPTLFTFIWLPEWLPMLLSD